MNSPLAMKLEHGAPLDDSDRRRLHEVVSNLRKVPAGVDLIRIHDNPTKVNLVVDGVACRYKLVDDGRRVIVAFMIAGDFCDLNVEILGRMDHSVATLTECTVAEIESAEIDSLSERHPRITRAFWWSTLVDEAVLREWIVGIARRPAEARVAHLFCELLMRMQTVGLADGGQFAFPLTQETIADATGLSTVYVNRVLQSLRRDGLMSFQGQRVHIPDVERLREHAGFDPTYLHLGRYAGNRAGAAA